MNAHARTATNLASAILGKRRVAQDVFVFCKTYGGPLGPRYLVLVTPHGAERGERYEVRQPMLDLLESGRSPESLDLDVYEPEDE